MRLTLKVGKILLTLLLATVALIATLFISLRVSNQHANASAFEIRDLNGINEAGYVRLGGIDQWVQIRGHNRDNPVLLCVHGGPGGTWLPVTRLFLPWEKEFTVVLWDQRGAGKTLKTTGASVAASMTLDRMTQDGIELAEHLRTRLGKRKIILLGHSFGSVLGVLMAKNRPDLFAAYIGTGQVSDLPRSTAGEFVRLEQRAQVGHDAATLRAIAQMGPPPFKNLQQVATFFEQAGKYQPAADNAALEAMKRSLTSPPPNYSLRDEVNRMRSFTAVPPWSLYNELLNTNLAALGPEFEIPVFFIQGRDDTVTPLAHAEEYFKTIRAPQKELLVLPDGGHFAVWSHADAFLQQLVAHVCPIVR